VTTVKKVKKINKTAPVIFLLKPKERRDYEEAATRVGLSLAEFCRRSIRLGSKAIRETNYPGI
jgi:hypothetical protein